jgi:hypothetical protein
MKKNFVVAMAMTAGLFVAGSGYVRPAFAGHWEEVQIDSFPWDPGFPSEFADRYQGETTEEADNVNGSGTTHYSYDYTWQESAENSPGS